jgi:hypothetical protein
MIQLEKCRKHECSQNRKSICKIDEYPYLMQNRMYLQKVIISNMYDKEGNHGLYFPLLEESYECLKISCEAYG